MLSPYPLPPVVNSDGTLPPYNPTTVIPLQGGKTNGGFYAWLIWLIIGLALIQFVPAKYRVTLIGTIILAGLVYIDSNGGLDSFWKELTRSNPPISQG